MAKKSGNEKSERHANAENPILLVEDNASDAELAIRALTKCRINNDVIIATNAGEALEYLFYTGRYEHREQKAPAMVLLDINLPKVSGIEVLKQIRSYNKTKNIPVVILSASEATDELVDALDDITGRVRKPSGGNDWTDAIHEIDILLRGMMPRGI